MTYGGDPELSDYGDDEFKEPCACDGEFGDVCETHCTFCRNEETFMRRLFDVIEPDTGLTIKLCAACKEHLVK